MALLEERFPLMEKNVRSRSTRTLKVRKSIEIVIFIEGTFYYKIKKFPLGVRVY